MLTGKTFIFQGNKPLPNGTIIIVTKNNEEELRSLLYHMTASPLFMTEETRVIIIDFYSFDKTSDVALEYRQRFPSKIEYLKKESQKSVLELVKPYTSDKFVEFINLAKIHEDHCHLPPKKFTKWLESIAKQSVATTTDGFSTKQIIKRIEKEQQIVHHVLRNEMLEPLSDLQMQLKSTGETDKQAEQLFQVIQTMIEKLTPLLNKFDPHQFSEDMMLPYIKMLAEDFSNRTQISCSITETGTPKPANYYYGISVVKMVQEGLRIIEKHGQATNIDVKMKWGFKKLTIKVSDNSTQIKKEKLSPSGLEFIEERATLLNGSFRLHSTQRGLDMTIFLPLPSEMGEHDAQA